jgi:hypothetical protein
MLLLLTGCVPDLSGISTSGPCVVEPPAWTEAQWEEFTTAPTQTRLDEWLSDARCRVHLLRVLGRSLTIAQDTTAGEIQGRGAQMQVQAVALKAHLLTMQGSVWRDCVCSPTPSCDHLAGRTGNSDIDPLCDGSSDLAERLVDLLNHMIDHAKFAANEAADVTAKVHGEHVLNCIQAGGEEDWDLSGGDAKQVCVGELNDYGLVGGGTGDLLRIQFEQVRGQLLP